MTPKEKAKELFDSFYEEMGHHLSKQAALISVQQIWRELEAERVFEGYHYWEEVKQEIEKL